MGFKNNYLNTSLASNTQRIGSGLMRDSSHL